ncbi:MAG: glycoside hydrolase [Thermoplasmata archaeon]|nr:glycoside hydrolase [Thermoplasmata archaeon]
MTDGATPMSQTTRRPPRPLRLATLMAVAIAFLMAVPFGALATSGVLSSSPSAATVVHAPVVRTAPTSISTTSFAARLLASPAVSPSFLGLTESARLADAAFGVGGQAALSHPEAPAPQALAGNTYLNDPCSTTSTVAAVNGTNSTLLAGVSSEYLLFNASGGSYCSTVSESPLLTVNGLVEAERSTDGGQTWTPSWIPQNASWTKISSPLFDSIPGMFYPYSGDGPAFASPSVAAANDGTVLLSTQFMPGCWISGCTNATGEQSPAGIAIARSVNGGASWVNTTVVENKTYFQWINTGATCTAAGLGSGFYPVNVPMSPYLAINPVTDAAVATWENFHVLIDVTNCTASISGTIQASNSLNGGLSWSAPQNVSGQLAFDPRVAIGPAPAYPVSIVYENWLNATQDSSSGALAVNWAVATSTDNGTTWGAPLQTASSPNVNLLWRGDSSPDSFFTSDNPFGLYTPSQGSLAFDSWASSTHEGNEYLVWSDNQTVGSTDQGYPAIAFEERASGSPGWTGTSFITPATKSTVYFQPSVSVAPDGTLWVTFYGESKSSGDLNMFAVYSTNGGTTWSTMSEITSSFGILANGLLSIGDYTGSVATSAGTYVTWMDCRSVSCTDSFNESTMVTLVEPVALTTSASGITLTVTTNGVASAVSLPGAVPWAIGTAHTVAAPGWLPYNATYVETFHNFTGAVNSTAFSTTFTYTGGSSLVTNYAFVPGSFLAGFFTPNTTFDQLTIDGFSVPLHPWNATALSYNYSVASGRSYYLNASASRFYLPLVNQILGTTAGAVTSFNVDLAKTHGWLIGRVTPTNATLLINGTPVVVDAQNGVYNTSAFWGSYWVNASGYGVTNFSQYVTVTPDQSTTTNIVLSGGWIRGALINSYPGISIKLDGVAISNLVGATFNDSTLGGAHQIVATATGYNTSTINVTVVPGHTSVVSVNLTNQGTVIGSISPVAALKVATLSVTNLSHLGGGHEPIDTTTGIFRVNVTGDAYWTVTVAATGYVTFTQNVLVTPGELTAPVSVTLTLAKNSTVPPCNLNNSCSVVTPSGSSGPSIALIGGIIVVVVVVAAVAAVVLMRRRGGGGGGDGSTPPEGTMGGPTDASGEATYGEGTYGAPPPAE